MTTAQNRLSGAFQGAVIVDAPASSKGVGQALRSAYATGNTTLPRDLQALLDRLR